MDGEAWWSKVHRSHRVGHDWTTNTHTNAHTQSVRMHVMTEHSVQFSSVVQSCLTLWEPINRSIPGFPVHHQFPESTHTHVHCVSDAIQPSHYLSSPYPPALDLSQHQALFKWVSSLHQVAGSFTFSISPSNEYSGLISFRMDWLDLLALQGTRKSLLQHHNSSVLSFLYSPTLTFIHDHWKNHSLDCCCC